MNEIHLCQNDIKYVFVKEIKNAKYILYSSLCMF